MSELPQKHSVIQAATASHGMTPQRIRNEIGKASMKAIPLLRLMAKTMNSISGGFDSRFRKALEETIKGGGAYGGLEYTWKHKIAEIEKEMLEEIERDRMT